VDPHLLRTFVTVVRLSSFSAAAAELGYTQAAVSQQIAALETDLKTVLLNRRPVTPTEAGTRLLDHADQILFRLDAARADLNRMTQYPASTLVIGATPLAAASTGTPTASGAAGGAAAAASVTGGSRRVAAALAGLRAQMPRADITLRVGARRDVATWVARGECDIGLVDGLAASGDSLPVLGSLSAVGVAEAEVVLVLPLDHPLSGRASVRLIDLLDARWIDAPGVAPPLSDIRRVVRTEGFRPALTYEGTDTLSLIALAAAGHGLTLLPTTLAFPGEFASVRVTDPRIVHRVELIHGVLRDGSPAGKVAALL
jgi:DNA-binding transcriptional LysR family regulator